MAAPAKRSSRIRHLLLARLVLRRRWAVPMFQVSLLGLLVQMVGAYAVTPAWAAFGPAGLAMPALLLVVAVALLLYARRAREGGWLR